MHSELLRVFCGILEFDEHFTPTLTVAPNPRGAWAATVAGGTDYRQATLPIACGYQGDTLIEATAYYHAPAGLPRQETLAFQIGDQSFGVTTASYNLQHPE